MQTLLFIWPVSSLAVFAMAQIIAGANGARPMAPGKKALLAAFWPMILTGLLVTFSLWYAQRMIGRDARRAV